MHTHVYSIGIFSSRNPQTEYEQKKSVAMADDRWPLVLLFIFFFGHHCLGEERKSPKYSQAPLKFLGSEVCIYSFNKYSLGTYYAPDAHNTSVYKIGQTSAIQNLLFRWVIVSGSCSFDKNLMWFMISREECWGKSRNRDSNVLPRDFLTSQMQHRPGYCSPFLPVSVRTQWYFRS